MLKAIEVGSTGWWHREGVPEWDGSHIRLSEASHSVLDLDTGQLVVNLVVGVTWTQHDDRWKIYIYMPNWISCHMQCSKLDLKSCQSCCLESQIINIRLKKSLKKVPGPPPKLSASGWRTGNNLEHCHKLSPECCVFVGEWANGGHVWGLLCLSNRTTDASTISGSNNTVDISKRYT